MYNRFIVAFLGFIFGCTVMSIIYDLRMAQFDMAFSTASGLPSSQGNVVKVVFSIMFLIALIAVIVKGPQKEVELNEPDKIPTNV
jgi:glycerol uptake facilitator-like aquaporin